MYQGALCKGDYHGYGKLYKDGFTECIANGFWDSGRFLGGYKIEFHETGEIFYKGDVENE